jgi:hypothetical protein
VQFLPCSAELKKKKDAGTPHYHQTQGYRKETLNRRFRIRTWSMWSDVEALPDSATTTFRI